VKSDFHKAAGGRRSVLVDVVESNSMDRMKLKKINKQTKCERRNSTDFKEVDKDSII
jgi:hypothetical protein